jgi:pyruvate/2-oxoglutarate dehydrogenase complex dihydrolipoamide dehydrogenase (E3) component
MSDSAQSERIRRKMKEQLAQPLKHAKVEVIEAEAKFKEDNEG